MEEEGSPGGLVVNNLPANAGDNWFDPWSAKIPAWPIRKLRLVSQVASKSWDCWDQGLQSPSYLENRQISYVGLDFMTYFYW